MDTAIRFPCRDANVNRAIICKDDGIGVAGTLTPGLGARSEITVPAGQFRMVG